MDVKEYDKEWYDTVENEVKMKTQVHIEEIRKGDFKDICRHEDNDLCVEEIESALSVLNNNSAPSPEEHIFNILLKRDGEAVAKACTLHFSEKLVGRDTTRSFQNRPQNHVAKAG